MFFIRFSASSSFRRRKTVKMSEVVPNVKSLTKVGIETVKMSEVVPNVKSLNKLGIESNIQ